MPFSGGVFSRVYNWVSDKNSSINITASRMDTEDTGFATGLSSCLLKDGTQTVTANIPMNSFKFTGLASGSVTGDSATVGQIQSGAIIYCGTSGGTANAQTLTPSPALAAYAAGNRFSFLPVATNTSGTVTIANSGLTARTVKKSTGGALSALAVGDIVIAVPAIVFDDGSEYVLMNPQTYTHGADIASATTTVLDTATGDVVDVTGTTTITAITLSEGRQCTVRFTGILTLTNGASLLLPGAANITTAASDFAVFRGYASGVVRCVVYTPLATVPGGTPSTRNLTAAGLVTGGGTLAADRTFTVTAAIETDMETPSGTTQAVVPAVMQNHPGVAKMVGVFDGTASSPITPGFSYGMSGTTLTKNSTGVYTVVPSTNFSSATKIVFTGNASDASGSNAVTVQIPNGTLPATNSIKFNVRNDAGTLVDVNYVSFAIFGDQ